MNCSELIALLSSFPPLARVIMDGYESGFNDVTKLELVNIKADANPDVDCFGLHLIDNKGPTTEAAVWIQCVNASGDSLSVQDLAQLKENGIW